jgi:hypothetical protein
MKAYRALTVSLATALAATTAMAATAPVTEATRLTSQYSEWAGGKSNADALIAGLRNGSPVTIVTNGSDKSVSIAGFTPAASMSYGNVGTALSNAQRSLARIGITKPTADQIQAALIGGEIALSNGSTTMIRGSVSPVASR